MDGRFSKEFEALNALTSLMADAETCKRLHEEAGLPLPRPLAVLFDLEKPRDDSSANPPALEIPRPPRPKRSPRGSTEWIYLPIEEAQETSLVLAVLSINIAVTPSAIVERVQSLRPQVNKGTIANIGTRLEQEQIIRRDHNGWMLVHGKPTPEIIDNYIWGTPGAFQKQELAAYRRMVILHVLRSYSDGLQVAQLTRTLETHCPWLSEDIPVTKFLVKADIEALADKKLVRMIDGSKKWGLTQ
jgi:hypothetical protein